MKKRKAKPPSKVSGKMVFQHDRYNISVRGFSGHFLACLCFHSMARLFPGIKRALPLGTDREVTITIEFGKEV